MTIAVVVRVPTSSMKTSMALGCALVLARTLKPIADMFVSRIADLEKNEARRIAHTT